MMIMSDELGLVEEVLQKAIASDVGLLARASERIVCSGGKRLRPKITLLAYQAVGGQDVRHVAPLAAAVELLHTASLIHDDINDHSDMRRGQPSVNARWGDGLALLVGDFVFVKFLGLIPTLDARVIRVLADCCTAIVEGETLQMLHQNDPGMTEDVWLSIVRKKTASLFAACGQLGAMVAGAEEEQVAALQTYGENLGIAFQIQDDTLDLVGKQENLGKPVCLDLEQGTASMAVLYALEHTLGAAEILRTGDQACVVQMLSNEGALDYAVQKAQAFAAQARSALSALPESEARSELCRLADSAVSRDR